MRFISLVYEVHCEQSMGAEARNQSETNALRNTVYLEQAIPVSQCLNYNTTQSLQPSVLQNRSTSFGADFYQY